MSVGLDECRKFPGRQILPPELQRRLRSKRDKRFIQRVPVPRQLPERARTADVLFVRRLMLKGDARLAAKLMDDAQADNAADAAYFERISVAELKRRPYPQPVQPLDRAQRYAPELDQITPDSAAVIVSGLSMTCTPEGSFFAR